MSKIPNEFVGPRPDNSRFSAAPLNFRRGTACRALTTRVAPPLGSRS